MKKSDFKEKVLEVLKSEVEELTWDEKVSAVRRYLVEAEAEQKFDMANKGDKWTDEELRMVLTSVPTKENCMRLAKAYKRGYGGIQQIYQWASAPAAVVKEKRPNDAFIKQIRCIAKEVGWI
jgi:hypothetical protein